MEWYSGNAPIWHVRGFVMGGRATSDHPWYNADTLGPSSWDVNLATGSGSGRGTFFNDVDGVVGGFEANWTGRLSAGLWSLKIAGHGTGELTGTRLFATITQIADFAPQPLPPYCDLATAAYDVVGEFLEIPGE